MVETVMCDQCNYKLMLESVHLEATRNRLRVLEVIGANNYPLTASEIFTTIDRTENVNKVTVYRILDLLVEKRLVDRIGIGGRAAHYGLAPNEHHAPHPHFLCTECAAVHCLAPESLSLNMTKLKKTFPGRVKSVQVQVEGICSNCLKTK